MYNVWQVIFFARRDCKICRELKGKSFNRVLEIFKNRNRSNTLVTSENLIDHRYPRGTCVIKCINA